MSSTSEDIYVRLAIDVGFSEHSWHCYEMADWLRKRLRDEYVMRFYQIELNNYTNKTDDLGDGIHKND